MSKVRINLITIGHIPARLNLNKIEKWTSSLFELTGRIENIALRCDSDIENWAYSDKIMKSQLPQKFDGDLLIAISNVPIEENYYSRRLGDNVIIFTFHEIKDMLRYENIPLENAILRILYAYTVGFHRAGRRIPSMRELGTFTHDETRGCIFDMNGVKQDIVESCHNPIVCTECQERIRKEKVSNQIINTALHEIKKIKKDIYYIITDFVKAYPVASIIISTLLALLVGIASSALYDCIKFAVNKA